MHLTRRFFLQSTGAVSAYLGALPLDLLAAASQVSAPVKRRKTLVVVFLRGGADGLNLVVPHGDPAYTALRPSIGIAPPIIPGGALDLDGFFGLHPRLEAMTPWFDSGHAVAAHAVGYDQNTRSHFEEQDVWETGVIGNTVGSDGWVNRHLATSHGSGPIRAVAVGENLPRILRGDVPTFSIRGIEDLALTTPQGADGDRVAAALERAYAAREGNPAGVARDVLEQSSRTTLEAARVLRKVAGQPYKPEAQYPNTDLARRMREVARLIKADVGLEVAEVDFGGWDTHQNQGGGAGGQFGNLVGQLGSAVDAFARDLGDHLNDVVLVTLTDFGRTAAENGTRGTDHGWANALLVLGGPVRAARAANGDRPVIGTWPGLAPDQLHEGRDLLHTTDFRDVIAELVRVHLGNPHLETVLPGHEFKPVGAVSA